MIKLIVIGEQGRAMPVASAPHFRITGGTIWIGPGAAGEKPLLRYFSGRWEYSDVLWSGMRFEGKSRLIFGVPRDPAGVSNALEALSLYGRTLSANGIPFAVYDLSRDMWRGVTANTWWHAFRVEVAEFRDSDSPSPGIASVIPGFRGTETDRGKKDPRTLN